MASSFQFLLSMGKVGPVVCVGFFLGVICACILVGGGKLLLLLFFFFPLCWAGFCQVVGFGDFVSILSADDYVYVFVFLVVWVRCPALDAAGSW